MKNNEFEYKYVAPTSEERREIESIRTRYLIKNKSFNKLEYLRCLDRKVKATPSIISIIIGVVGILIFGLGFAMVLEWDLILWGVVVSIGGVCLMLVAYPVYKYVIHKLKNKYSKEILEISSELLNDENKEL